MKGLNYSFSLLSFKFFLSFLLNSPFLSFFVKRLNTCTANQPGSHSRKLCDSGHAPAVFLVTRIGSCGLVTWSCYVGQDRQTWVTGSRASMSCALRPAHLEPQWGASPHALTLYEGARVYRFANEAPLFRQIPTRPEAFLEPPRVSGLQPSGPTHLKKGLVLH